MPGDIRILGSNVGAGIDAVSITLCGSLNKNQVTMVLKGSADQGRLL